MAGFFSGLHSNIPNPDVVMNRGPLPPREALNWPVGFNGTPDGRIGSASTLLGGVQPYSYGGPDRLSTQAAYLNIPHVTQRLVPALQLPSAQLLQSGGGMMELHHQVDDGDVAFVVRCMFSAYEMVANKHRYKRQGVLFAIDPLINLTTVNYLLHGLQRYGWDKREQHWHTLWVALGIAEYEPGWAVELSTSQRKELVTYLVQNVIKPFGVPRGSERQGGQHQGLNSPVT